MPERAKQTRLRGAGGMDRRALLRGGGLAAAGLAAAGFASGTSWARGEAPDAFEPNDVINSGHRFFGSVSRGLASVVEEATRRWGRPNGYILGQEASGAFIGGLRYGEGTLFTRNVGDTHVFWQGPSVGFDWGGDGARTMMLAYGLPAVEALFTRYVGINGAAYFVGGFGMTALAAGDSVVVPIRSGLGFRLGANIGYLKFTPEATWNPF
ncbi:MAG: DUF1134 domain-containing protein [Hyphomicrobiales bacterium]